MEEKNLEEMEEEMVGVVVVGVLMVVGGLSQTQLRTTALAASERRLTSIVDESPEFFLNSRFYKLLKTNIYITAVLKLFLSSSPLPFHPHLQPKAGHRPFDLFALKGE